MTALNTRREILVALAGAAVGITVGTDAFASPQTGTSAPGFTAVDSKGKRHTLAAYKGKIVVLEWTNHECPYTVKHYATGNMQALQMAATESGAIWLTVVSSRPGSQGHVEALEADKLTADRHAHPTAVLLDPAGDLGKLYGARVNASYVRHRCVGHARVHGRHRRSADGRPCQRQGCAQLRARSSGCRRRGTAGRRGIDAPLRLHREVLTGRQRISKAVQGVAGSGRSACRRQPSS
jgi:peroxiredoxin